MMSCVSVWTYAAIAAQTTLTGTALSVTDRTAVLNLPTTPDLNANLNNDPSAERLLELARRPATAALVDASTSSALSQLWLKYSYNKHSISCISVRTISLSASRLLGAGACKTMSHNSRVSL